MTVLDLLVLSVVLELVSVLVAAATAANYAGTTLAKGGPLSRPAFFNYECCCDYYYYYYYYDDDDDDYFYYCCQ